MKKYILILGTINITLSCNLQSKSGRSSGDPDRVFSLKLKPVAGSRFRYDVSNESKTEIEVNDKKVVNISKSDVSVIYSIEKDSLGNYLVGIRYDKIHIYTKSGDTETDVDAGNSENSMDPIEQMLGGLKNANIIATIDPGGKVVHVNGYQEILNKVLNGMGNESSSTKTIIQKRWQQMVEQNLVKKNMGQLFDLFPDSAVHVGDKWKFVTKEKDDLAFKINNTFTLNSIENNIASLVSHGQITADSSETNLMGYDVNAAINGEQNGEYELNIKAGMPETIKVSISLDGVIQVNGREIPFTLKSTVKMKGQQDN